MSSIMRARSGLMGVSLIGVLLVLRLGFGHPHPQARALQIPLPLALPGLNAASARVIAAGYRVSGFVPWRRPEIRLAAATESGIGGEPDAPERRLEDAATAESDPGCVKTCTEQKSLESYSHTPPVQRPPRYIVPERRDVSRPPEV